MKRWWFIGADSPTTPAEYLDRAFDIIKNERESVVLGPASDEGTTLSAAAERGLKSCSGESSGPLAGSWSKLSIEQTV